LAPTSTIALFGNPATHGHLKSGDVVTAVLLDPDAVDGDTNPRTEYVIVEGPHPAGDAMIAKITGTVSARSGDTLGTGTAAIGHPVDGDWTQVEESETILNPSNMKIVAPSGYTIMLPVNKINGA